LSDKSPNKTMLLKGNCWAKTRPSVAFSKLWRYNFKGLGA
jgi:hypothetical protein